MIELVKALAAVLLIAIIFAILIAEATWCIWLPILMFFIGLVVL